MRKELAFLLSLAMAAALTAPALAAPFEKVHEYAGGQFSDVPAGSPWAENVRTAWEYGIMSGKTGERFDPGGNVTIAQAIVMACRLHSGFAEDGAVFEASDPWYQSYTDYARENGITTEVYADYDAAVTRAGFALILGAALPDEALPPVSSVEEGGIPDVPERSNYHDAVYRLYRAGVLTGNDASGTFAPASPISRGAAAAIVSRMADPSLRKEITLEKAPFRPVPMKELSNLASLRKRCTDEELSQAYGAALELVTPLADLSLEDQLSGVALALRQRFESGMSYSMESSHYNDPYGYFVLGEASCAGCTRATGLCLNILGIPYEHVNENEYAHQWCRVNVNGTYWICDAYGLYCGPEPAPYTHPYL